jgi:flagellar biosynthesis GTPase FlhF
MLVDTLNGGLWAAIFYCGEYMKRANSTLFRLCLLAALALGMVATVQADETGPATTVSYDRQSDRLTVIAESASLKSVLARVAQLAGIEVLFDDRAEGTLSVNIQSESLENGLKHILKGRNSILRYSKNKQEKLLLVGVMVLPAGEQDSARAKPLVAMDDEAYNRARSQLTQEQVRQMDKAAERWQARMSEMSPERRAAMEKRVKKRLLKKQLSDQKQAEQRKQDQLKLEQAQAEQRAQREKALQKLDPETRDVLERRREAAHEQMRQQLMENSR